MKAFDDNKTTTETTIMSTDLQINLVWLLHTLPILECEEKYHTQLITCKKHDKFNQLFKEIDPPYGTFVMVNYKDTLRGYTIKKKKKSKKRFRNSLNVVIYADKLITIKIPNKGNLHFTGCSNSEQSMKFIKYLWDFLRQYPQNDDTYKLLNSHFIIRDLTVMTNIVFNVGFTIDKQKLDTYVNTETEFRSILATSIGYNGVNIKLPFNILDEKIVRCMEYVDGKWIRYNITFDEHIREWDKVKYTKELNKARKNTFLVFYSGTVIMTGMNRLYMRDAYYKFWDVITKSKNIIKERILD